MIYVAYIPATRPTGKNIARLLSASFGTRTARTADTLIRWGSRRPLPAASLVLNEPEAIARASDKLRAFAAMSSLSVVPHARTYAEARERWPVSVLLGRNRSGARGTDIVPYTPEQRPEQEHAFYTPFIESRDEARIHVVQGSVIRVQKKYLVVPEDRRSPYIRNYENGFRFSAPQRDLKQSRLDAAVAAVDALGLDFGAVDMLLVSEREHCILEVNTAPGCSPLTAQKYADALGEIVC